MKATATHPTRLRAGINAVPIRRPARWHQLAARCGGLVMAPAASMFVATGAQAQADPCEQLKSVLAARIPPEVRGYSMETVPANAPVPPGAKAIGNCGANKILYRRFGGSSPPPVASASIASAPIGRTTKPTPASAPAPIAAPAPVPLPAAVPPPAPRPVEAAPIMAAPKPAPVQASASRVADKVAAPNAEAVASQAAPPPLDQPRAASPPLTQRVTAFFATGWRWIGVLLLLPLTGWLWAWVAHRRAYDAAGLPRGPRL